jgi:phosphatidylserine decarboxylase
MNSFINPQGIKPVTVLALLTFISYLIFSDTLTNILFFITLFVVFIYRDTSDRKIFTNTQNVLAPVDGKVFAIDFVDDKQKIYINTNLCQGHNVKAPNDGEYKIKKYKHGLNLNPNSFKGSLLNEQITVKFNHFKLKLISGICNAKIDFDLDKNATQGESIGLFLQGNAIITVKKDHKLLVNIGEKLVGGQSVLFRVD